MRKLFGLIVAATLVVAGPARAAVLGFTGSLVTAFQTPADLPFFGATFLPSISAPGAGTATISGTSLTTLALPAGAFSVAFISMPVTDPANAPIAGVIGKNIKNGAGSFNLGGKMAVQGSQFICIGGAHACAGPLANLTVPFTANGTRGVGLGGAPIFFLNTAANIGITVNGNPWVATTAKVGTATIMGFVHGPASGGAATAGQASGVIQLVTPVMVSTSIGALGSLPGFGTLNLHFVPEPSTLLLLTSGVVALGMLGRRRMSK